MSMDEARKERLVKRILVTSNLHRLYILYIYMFKEGQSTHPAFLNPQRLKRHPSKRVLDIPSSTLHTLRIPHSLDPPTPLPFD